MRAEITEALKAAMKAGEKIQISTLRLMNAAIKDRDIEARGAGKGPLSDDDLAGLFQKMIKQRQESAAIYDQASRPELAEQERAEIAVIQTFLPQQLDAAASQAAIAETIKETGATSVRDMGKVMAALKQRYAGKMDFTQASVTVKALLG